MENYHKVATTLKTLINKLDGRDNNEIDIGDVNSNNNKFTITFPTTLNEGYSLIVKLSDKLKEAGLIDATQRAEIQVGILNHGIITSGKKCDLNLKYDTNTYNLKLTFSPKLKLEELYEHLDKIVELAASSKSPLLIANNLPATDLSPLSTTEKIVGLLHSLNKIPDNINGYNTKVNPRGGFGFKDAEARANGEFIINYGTGANGNNSAIKFIKLLNGKGYKLDVKIKDDDRQLTIKPDKLEEFESNLQQILDKMVAHMMEKPKIYIKIKNASTEYTYHKKPTQQEELSARRFEKGISARLPDSVKRISDYLKEKTESAFPSRNVKITYSTDNEKNGADPLFVVNIDYKKQSDEQKLQELIKDLSKVFTKNGAIGKLETGTTSAQRIGFCVNCKTHILLENINKDRAEKLSKDKSSFSR